MKTTSRFRIVALPVESFKPFFSLKDIALTDHCAKWVTAEVHSRLPCRVSLQNAKAGERLLLLPFIHQPANSPYRASGPIFVRETAEDAEFAIGEIPEALQNRLLSLRAYTADGLMAGAEVIADNKLQEEIAKFFSDERVAYLHLHYARPGCYACRIDRA